MRILLIQSPLGRVEPVIYPSALGYIAGSLPEHELRIFDPNLPGAQISDIHRFTDFQPELVGISLRNIDSQMLRDLAVYVPPFEQLVKQARSLFPNAQIIVGGTGFSLFPRQIMQEMPEIDIGVYLEGEQTIRELANGKAPEHIKGIFYRTNQDVIFSGARGFEPFLRIPKTDWERVSPAPYKLFPGAIGVQTKRGCSLTCAYCTYPLLNGKLLRCRRPEDVVQELEYLISRHGVQEVMFVDAVFNNPLAHAEAIVRRMITRGLPLKWSAWFSECRLTKDFIHLAIKSGCAEFSFSPDGTTEKTLKLLGKDNRPIDNERLIRLAEEIPGMRISMSFFINPPGNDFASFSRLLSYFLRIKILRHKRTAGFILSSPRIEPGTQMEAIAIKEGILAPGTNLFPHSLKELRQFFYRNRSMSYIEYLFSVYIGLWKVNQWLRSKRLSRKKEEKKHDLIK